MGHFCIETKIFRAILTCVTEHFHFLVVAWPVLFQLEYLCFHLLLEAEIYMPPILSSISELLNPLQEAEDKSKNNIVNCF